MDSLCLCRVCLSNKSLEYIDLETHLSKDKTYLECFNDCTKLSAQSGDKLPSMLCFNCAQELQKTYEFIISARKTDIVLRKRLADPTSSTEKVVQILSTNEEAFLKEDFENMEIVVIKPLEGQMDDTILDDQKEDKSTAFNIDDYANSEFILGINEKDDLTEAAVWKCHECNRLFNSSSSHKEHTNCHEKQSFFKCTKCTKSFRTQRTLERHYNVRHTAQMKSNKAQIKLHDEYTEDALEHCEIEHSDDESIQSTERENSTKLPLTLRECTICKKKLLERNMDKHLELHTHKQENYLCAYCPRYFKYRKSVRQHEKTHFEESDDILYVCIICDRQYSTKALLEQHRKNTHKEREHACTICGNAFKLRNQLTNHMKLHLEKNIQCPHCDKKYARQFDLNVHLRSHTGERPYQCPLCEKRFAIKVRLTYHLQKHYGVKHTCKECGAQFNSKQKLKSHSFKHTGMPYRCGLCDDHGFPNRDVFKRHLLRVHQATITEQALLEMFQRFTGKTTRIREISVSLEEDLESSQDETTTVNKRQTVAVAVEKRV